jgi:hypothetical protein
MEISNRRIGLTQPTGVGTFAIRRSQRTDQKLQKSFHLTDPKENFIFFSNPLKNKKRTVQPTRQ